MRRCKALSERGFSAAAFRGKFPFAGKDMGAPIGSPKAEVSGLDNAPEGPAFEPESSDEPPKRDPPSGTRPKPSLSLNVKEEDEAGETITNEMLCDPEEVPLLAVVGWEGDGKESASLASSYLTLWNVSKGSAFLRLKTPALQVLSLEW